MLWEGIFDAKANSLLRALIILFETGIKHPIMQPIDGIEPAIGCLFSFESWIK